MNQLDLNIDQKEDMQTLEIYRTNQASNVQYSYYSDINYFHQVNKYLVKKYLLTANAVGPRLLCGRRDPQWLKYWSLQVCKCEIKTW